MTGKGFKTKKKERICRFCDLNEVEDEDAKIKICGTTITLSEDAEIIRTPGRV